MLEEPTTIEEPAAARYGVAGNTGVALALAVSKFVAASECRQRNYIVALFDEEERGLLGSGHFARFLKDRSLNIHSVHTVDQMGYFKKCRKAG